MDRLPAVAEVDHPQPSQFVVQQLEEQIKRLAAEIDSFTIHRATFFQDQQVSVRFDNHKETAVLIRLCMIGTVVR